TESGPDNGRLGRVEPTSGTALHRRSHSKDPVQRRPGSPLHKQSGRPRPPDAAGQRRPDPDREVPPMLDEKLQTIYDDVVRMNPAEDEFHQAVSEVLSSLGLVVTKHPEFLERKVIQRIC